MKPVSLLIALCVLFGFSLHAQTTTTVEKNAKRITITTTKTDENGKPVTETWIAEGDQPEAILNNMANHPDVLQKIDADKSTNESKGERLFLIRKAGESATVEGRLDDIPAQQIQIDSDGQKVIIWSSSNGEGDHEYKVANWYAKNGSNPWEYNDERKPNCAALGVYVNTTSTKTGCMINSLIDKGGAQEAGLTEGDVITKLDDYTVTDFPALYDALTHYLPGDDVTVAYERDGKLAKINVHLKSWADLPGHEWRARGDCGKIEDFKEETVQPQVDLTPGDGPVAVEPLQLDDVRMYPNPTSERFDLSFTMPPGSISISVTDVNGKVVYSENNDNSTGYYHHDIDLKNAPSGNYIVTVKQGDKVFTQQLSKQ